MGMGMRGGEAQSAKGCIINVKDSDTLVRNRFYHHRLHYAQ